MQGSEFDTQVDVGQCSSEGGCGQGESCQPVGLELRTIPAPHGQLINKASECSLYICVLYI